MRNSLHCQTLDMKDLKHGFVKMQFLNKVQQKIKTLQARGRENISTDINQEEIFLPTVILAGSAIQHAHHCLAEKRLHAVASNVPFSSGKETLKIIIHRESSVVEYLPKFPC